MKFPHRILEGAEEQAVIDDLMARIPTLNKAGSKERWEKGWKENLEAYRKSGNIHDLRPKYIRANQPVRLNGKFVMPEDHNIEAKWYHWFFTQIAQKWLADAEAIWEFGCGSCHNVATLARAWPDKTIMGLDWSQASIDICSELYDRGRKNVYGMPFDFFDPPKFYGVGDRVMLTVGALEQTGTRWGPFLGFLLAAKPRRVVHIEPQISWYDPRNPVDVTAIEAHKARGFWQGYYAMLMDLEAQGIVKIEHKERTGFGSLWIEGYSQLIWHPI